MTQTTQTQTTLNEQTREGFRAGLFAARYLCPPDRAFICPNCSRAMHRRVFGETGDLPDGGVLYGFACNTCHTLMLADAENCMDAAEKLGVLA